MWGITVQASQSSKIPFIAIPKIRQATPSAGAAALFNAPKQGEPHLYWSDQ
ncbi:Unknown protein sequence [Pseudomonas syringae pv. maculicola]|nr:Unknown protein sequence [Pseudomonas syringae pv. maculicola]